MAAEEDAGVQQYYALALSEKSAGVDGIRRAKAAAIVRLLRSVRCEKAVIRCSRPDDSRWLGSVLKEAGLTVANMVDPSEESGAQDICGEHVNGPSQIYIAANEEAEITTAESGSLLINLDLPNEPVYMQSLRQIDLTAPSHFVVTCVTPLELVDLKSYAQPDPAAKIKPLPEVLPGLPVKGKGDKQDSTAEPLGMPDAPKQTADELQARKEWLLQALDAMCPDQNGSAQAAAAPGALPSAPSSSQNGHGPPALDPVTTEGGDEDEVPPPPLGSPGTSQAATGIGAGPFQEAGIPVGVADAISAGLEEAFTQGAGARLGGSAGAFQGSAESAGRRSRQRSAQEAAARKEEQQELALERAILEIHWRQAEAEDGFSAEEIEEMAEEDAELEEGELAAQATAAAESQPPAAPALTGPVSLEHLPAFYQQWGRLTAGKASTSAGQAADAAARLSTEPSAQTAAWVEWFQQHGSDPQAAPEQQAGGASSDKAAEDVWQQWHGWEQQQEQGDWAGSAPSWNAWEQQGGAFPWAAQGAQALGREGFVSVPAALLQRYQMLEWAEWCRQYQRWQAAYEQWYSWWSSQMWQASAYYGAGPGHGGATSAS